MIRLSKYSSVHFTLSLDMIRNMTVEEIDEMMEKNRKILMGEMSIGEANGTE